MSAKLIIHDFHSKMGKFFYCLLHKGFEKLFYVYKLFNFSGLYRNLKGISLLFLSAVFMLNTVHAQTETLFPSASSIAALKSASGDLNMYSGKIDLNIPIYTIREGSVSLNIALKYTGGSGIKVQEIAGEAGLGWALVAGSVITRTVNRNMEEPNSGLLNGTDSLSVLTAINKPYGNKLNLDVFNSSLGGRIVYDLDNKAHFMKEQGFKIEEDGINSPDRRWVIVSPAGDKYYFGETLASKEMFVVTSSSSSGSYKVFSPLACAWHLSKIVSSKGEVIQFEYEKGNINNLLQYKYWEMNRIKYSYNPNWVSKVTELNSQNGKIRLSKISSSHSTIQFFYKNRADLQNGDAISEISVSDKSNALVTKFLFETDYFKSADSTPAQRLKLKALRQQTPALETHLLAAFEYNETENLPMPNSTKIDHWGYYNNNNTGKYFVSEGADRAANLSKCTANILTGIRWPTGGSTKYAYELNDYIRNGVQYSGGGLRISSITEMDSTKVLNKNIYDYSTLLSAKKVSSGLMHSLFDVTKGYISDYTSKNYFMTDRIVNTMTENALPVKKIIDLDGITIGYSKVTLLHIDQSSEEYNFQDYATFPDEVKYYRYTYLPFKYTTKDMASVNSMELYNGLNAVTSNNQQRGLITKKVIRNSKNEILKSIDYKYNTLVGTQIAGLETITVGDYNPDDKELVNTERYMLGAAYTEKVMAVRLSELKEESFYPGSPTTRLSTTINEYKPFPQPFLMTKQTQKQSDGTFLSSSYSYPSDMVATGRDNMGVYANMINRNIIIPVIEKIDRADNLQISLNRTNYSLFNFGTGSLVLPKSIEYQSGSNPIETNMFFNSYDAKGNPLETSVFDGATIVTLWGYNNQYPILEVKNATYENVKIALGETMIANLAAKSVTSGEIWSAAAKLRKALPKALISTSTYNPLFGIRSRTNERGMSEYYDYDEFGRLIMIKDHNGYIQKTFCYNERGQKTDCTNGTFYLNRDRSQKFKKNDCGIGYTSGSEVTYMVPAGKYSSTASQYHADQQAQDEIDANGQAYANENGTCIGGTYTFYIYNDTDDQIGVTFTPLFPGGTNKTIYVPAKTSGYQIEVKEGKYDIYASGYNQNTTFTMSCGYSSNGQYASFKNVDVSNSCSSLDIYSSN
ncbi:hypothetical protein A9970_22760 [Sphingobacterium sp. UME9]|nr:hypothetical protein [Sphingobacterium sp. UME9]